MSNIKSLQETEYNLYKYVLTPLTHTSKYSATKNYQALSRALRFRLVKDTTINSSIPPKSHVKIVTYMNSDNVFDILLGVVFSISHQLGGIVPKSQDLVT